MEQLTFDRESAIVVMQEDIEAKGIKLTLKAAGQKVGLAEVTIRLIREKARATKAGIELCTATCPFKSVQRRLISRHSFCPKSNDEGGLYSYALRVIHGRQGGPESRLQMSLGRVSDSQETQRYS